MKIVFLSDDFPPQSFGGAGISTYELALAVKKAGQEVFVVTTCRNTEDEGEFDYGGLKVFRIANSYPVRWRTYLSLYNPPVIKKLEKILKKIGPDVVHINNIHAFISYHSFKLSKRYSRAVVFTARDVMPFNYGKLVTKKYLENFDAHISWIDEIKQAKKRWNPLRRIIIKHYLKYADKKFTVSEALKKAFEQNGINNFVTLHTGIDLEEWRASSPEKVRNFKNRFSLEGKKILLFAGRLSGSKGGHQAIKLLSYVSSEISDVVLLVAGNTDSYSDAMKEEAKRLGIENKVIFTGWVEGEDIKYAMAASHIVLVPSICFDSFPRTVLEAMACGKPVIGTKYGGAKEAIEDGKTGYVVNPLDVKIMAEKTVNLLKNDQKSREFGQAARERIIRNFDQEDKVRELVSFYKKTYTQ